MPGAGERRRASRVLAAGAFIAATVGASGSLNASQARPDAGDLERERARLQDLQGSLGRLVSRHEAAQRRLESVQANLIRVEGEARRLAQRILKEEERAKDLARELYKEGNIAGMEAVLGSRSLGEMEDAVEYLGSSHRSHAEVFERLAADRRLLQERLEELEAAHVQAADTESEMEELRGGIATEVQEQQDRVVTIRQEIEAARDRRARLAALRAQREAQRAEREAERVLRTPEPEPEPVPQPQPQPDPPPVPQPDRPAPAPPPPSGGRVPDWDAIAMCESSQRWHLNSTYDGGLQFDPDTWIAYGGGRYAAYAYQASRLEQIAIAERVLDGQGPGAWPNCFQWK